MTQLERLVSHLKRRGVLGTAVLEEAFLRVNRRDFLPREDYAAAFGDHPLPIGGGQTISQPFTVAFMLELLEVGTGQSILDIGSGSGWTTALLAYLTGDSGRVKGLERLPELAAFGRTNLARYPFPWAGISRAGHSLGDPGARYDRILVSAAAPSFPEELADQLNPGGILVIPVKNSLWKMKKEEEALLKEEFFGFAFVPLIY